MSSGSPPLPPSSFANAHAQVRIDQIAVRIISLPDTWKTHTPQKGSGNTPLTATVTAYNDDGSLTLHTDHGDIRIMLRDKATLPEGSSLTLTLPAGRSAQQATISTIIHPADIPPPTPAPALPTAPSTQQNPIITHILTDDTIPSASSSIPIAGGPLIVDQLTRLLPLGPQLESALLVPSVSGLSANDMTHLMALINALPVSGLSADSPLRTMLITLLSQMDMSFLEEKASPPTADIRKTAQFIDLSLFSNFDTIEPLAPVAPEIQQNVPFLNTPQPLDGRIIALLPDIRFPITINELPHINSTSTSPATLALAQIVSNTDTKLPVLSIIAPHSNGSPLYTLQFRANNLPVGTILLLMLNPAPPTAPLTPPALPTTSHTIPTSELPPELARQMAQWIATPTWDNLDQLATILTTKPSVLPPNSSASTTLSAPPLAAQMMIPSPAHPHNMEALSLFFLALIRSGDSDTGWLNGDAVTLLRQMGKTSQLHAATADLGFVAKLDQLALPQDWRMTLLPLLWNNHIHKAPLYYKHMPDESDPESDTTKKRKKLRFLFDLSLSRMGSVQVDGFMQSQRLDIILRTRTALSPPMQRQMKQIYAGAMDKSRLTGDLSFQFKPDQWVNVTDFSTHSPSSTGIHA